MVVLTFGGPRTNSNWFSRLLSHKERYTRAWTHCTVVRRDCEIYRKRALKKAKLVFMANYPLERREDS